MGTQRRRRALLLPRPVTTVAVMLCVLAAIALDSAPGVAAADGESPAARDCSVFVRTNTLQVQARVRPSPSHRIPQPAIVHDALQPPAVIQSGAALSRDTTPANRQRLARLTTLRI